MEIIIHGRNLELTEAIRQHAQKKLEKLEKYLGGAVLQVALGVNKGRQKAEITVNFHGLTMRAEEETGDLYASIDGSVKVLEEQIHRHRAKIVKKIRHGGKEAHPFWGQVAKAEEDPDDKIVRHKRFSLKPMELEEAILQLNLLGHDFFVFADAGTKRVNVIYRRKDGDYGVLEPEI